MQTFQYIILICINLDFITGRIQIALSPGIINSKPKWWKHKICFKKVWNTELYYATYRSSRASVICYNSIFTTITDLSKYRACFLIFVKDFRSSLVSVLSSSELLLQYIYTIV